jgi:hypothetical protein
LRGFGRCGGNGAVRNRDQRTSSRRTVAVGDRPVSTGVAAAAAGALPRDFRSSMSDAGRDQARNCPRCQDQALNRADNPPANL